jgi:hypothetical protein
MNAGKGHRTIEFEYGQAISEFDVILKFSITDTVPLWQAAAQRLRNLGLGADDIDDTLGPIDDPTIRDCLLTITMPDAVDGCLLEEFEASPGGVTPVAMRGEIVSQERKLSSHTLETIVDVESDWRTGLDVPVLCVAGTLPGPDHVSALPN